MLHGCIHSCHSIDPDQHFIIKYFVTNLDKLETKTIPGTEVDM